ncbi:hypothetical protein [Novosphingobium sp. KN65.2]|uniref:hypothetical protein n=1 Tax=Novosphingobium sp. KN65.2 TaxID=1478134 RepID=UPI0005E23BEB|nr:hypothetical protein [Novosphingobium sp. KN65.2]CDO38955.1 hypothetical protein SPHV1_880008 [Novosphingobium sp. KN65.2]
MSIRRTFEISDLTPQEMASVFLGWDGEQQAEFFNSFKAETDTWQGAGWCQQSCEISLFLDAAGIETILKLAEWASEPFQAVERDDAA